MRRTADRGWVSRTMSVVLALSLIVLASCTTLPEPADGSDTAFVLPVVRVARSESSSTFGYYEIYIGRIGDPAFEEAVTVYAGTDMRVVTGLEPGRYVLRGYQFMYKNGGRGGSGSVNVPFLLEAGAITISPTTPVITLYKKDPDASTNWMGIRFKDTTPPTRQEVLDALEQEEAFASWRVLSVTDSRG